MKVEKISDEIWLGSPPGSRTPRCPVTGDDVTELNRLVTHAAPHQLPGPAKDVGRVESTQHDGQNEGVDREMSSNQQGGGKVCHLFRVDFFDQPGRAGTFPRVMN